MRFPTLLASLLVLLTRTEQIWHVFAYYVPRISSRFGGWKRLGGVSSRNRYDAKGDRNRPPIAELRFSTTDTSSGFQDESTYFAGDEEDILKVYEEWRIEYGKGEFDNSRYLNFKANYVKLMTANAAELTVARDMGCPDPVPLTLNEYGDFSPEEFSNVQNGQTIPTAPSEQNDPITNNGFVDPQQTTEYSTHNGVNEQDHIRQKYQEWCFMNQKVYDESRLEIFATNLRVVENYCRETGKKAELNEYADLSPDEYRALVMSTQPETTTHSQQSPHVENMSTYRQTPPSTLNQYFDDTEVQRIRQEYLEWCGLNGKEFTESRLEIFATNLLAVESCRAETGQNAFLNAYADLSPEEYNEMLSSGLVEAPSNDVNSFSSKVAQSSYAININSDESSVNSASTTHDQGIRAVYQDWCDYYEKQPTEDGLYHFRNNYGVLENHYRKTGEEFTLNEYADSPREELSQDTEPAASAIEENQAELEKLQIEEQLLEEAVVEEEQIKEESDRSEEEARLRMEKALRNENERKKAVEEMENEIEKKRKEEEERAKFEEAKKRVEEAQLLEQQQAAAAAQAALEKRKAEAAAAAQENAISSDLDSENDRLRQDRTRLEDVIKSDKARLEDEKRLEEEARKALDQTELQINAMMKEDERYLTTEEYHLQQERDRLEEALENEQVRLQEEKCREEEARKALEEADRQIDELMREDEQDIESEKLRLQQERLRLEQALKIDQELLKEEKRLEEKARKALEETNRQIEELSKQNQRDASDKPDPIILPRASYMDAVAKTWIDRTAYLEALQEGRAGALPYNPNYAQKPSKREVEKQMEEQLKIKESESLINSIWNFMKENNTLERGTENYSKNLIRQADQLIEETSNKSTGVIGEELRFLKKAVDAMRRRSNDDQAADRARTETTEWEQIQKGLEKEAKLAKQRREHDERIAEEARQKARSLRIERRQHEKRAEEARRREKELRGKNEETVNKIRSLQPAFEEDSPSQGNTFSFFSSPVQVQENKNDLEPKIENKRGNIFSFFGGTESTAESDVPPLASMTQAVKTETKKDSWVDAVFGFLAGEDTPDEIPGQGTITLEPAKKKSVFDFFVSPDTIAPVKEPGRGSITIDDSQESIFSFFAKFGVIQKKEKVIDPVRRKRVMDYESKLRTRQEKLSLLKAGRSRILNEKDKKLSRKEARRLQRELDALAAGDYKSSSPTSSAPQLVKWVRTPDGRITGWISEAAGGQYRMGTRITTSPVKETIVKPGMTITTISGSQYRLGLTAAMDSAESTLNDRQINDKRAGPLPSFMGSLFGRVFAEENVPSLVEWIQNEDGTITGFVTNKVGFQDGTQITTSPVEMGVQKGMVIQTKGGSKYKLMSQNKSNDFNSPSTPKF